MSRTPLWLRAFSFRQPETKFDVVLVLRTAVIVVGFWASAMAVYVVVFAGA